MPFGGGVFTDYNAEISGKIHAALVTNAFRRGGLHGMKLCEANLEFGTQVTNAFRRGGLHGLHPCKSLTLCGSSAQQVGTWFGRDGLNGLDTFLGAIFGGNWLKYSGLWP